MEERDEQAGGNGFTKPLPLASPASAIAPCSGPQNAKRARVRSHPALALSVLLACSNGKKNRSDQVARRCWHRPHAGRLLLTSKKPKKVAGQSQPETDQRFFQFFHLPFHVSLIICAILMVTDERYTERFHFMGLDSFLDFF